MMCVVGPVRVRSDGASDRCAEHDVEGIKVYGQLGWLPADCVMVQAQPTVSVVESFASSGERGLGQCFLIFLSWSVNAHEGFLVLS